MFYEYVVKRWFNASDACGDTPALPSASGQQVPGEYLTTSGEYGLAELVRVESPVADLVFVHGLTGNRRTTWTKDDVLWPEKLLPEILKDRRTDAQIYTFGYDADIASAFGATSQSRLREHGQTLVHDIALKRRRTGADVACRPLIFIGHSLGGLVIEEALTISHGSQQNHHRSIVEATRAICFMGTPHLGADLATWGAIASNFADLFRRTNGNIIKVLKPNSEVLSSLQQRFHTMIEQRRKDGKQDIEMFCFHEELPYTGIGLIVPMHSAVLSSRSSAGIPANHVQMTKFSRPEDIGFERVSDQLWFWLSQLKDEQDKDSSEVRPKDASVNKVRRVVSVRSDQRLLEYNTESRRNGHPTDCVKPKVHRAVEVGASDRHITSQRDVIAALIAPHSGILKDSLHQNYRDKFYLYRYAPAFFRIARLRHERTLGWLGSYEPIDQWLHDESSNLLWLHGGLGTGKSVMMAHLAKEVLPKALSRDKGRTPTVLYSFCDEVVNNSASSALATAIHQLLLDHEVRSVAFECDNLSGLGKAKADVCSVSDLWQLLCETIQQADIQSAFLVLDNIDACEMKSRRQLMKFLRSASTANGHSKLKVIISSREPPTIPGTTSLRIDEIDPYHTQDMDRYCLASIEAATKGRSFDRQSTADIFAQLRKNNAATFLSLALLVRKLYLIPRTGLADYKLLPVNPEDFYRHSIDNLPAESRALCLQILRILLFTFQPLTVVQLYHATRSFGRSLDVSEDYYRNLFQKGFMVARRCMEPFLRTDSGVIEPIHCSAKAFVLNHFQFSSSQKEKAILDVQRAHEDISLGCLTLLVSSSTLEWPAYWQDAAPAQALLKKCMDSDPLLEYASAHWSKHLVEATKQVQRHQLNPQLLAVAIDFAKLWEDLSPERANFRTTLLRQSHMDHLITSSNLSPLGVLIALRIKAIIYYILAKDSEKSRMLAARTSHESAIHQAIGTGQVEILAAVMECFDMTSLEGVAYAGVLQKAVASRQADVVRQVLRLRRRKPEELAKALNDAMAARDMGALEALSEELGTFSDVEPLWKTNTLHRLFWNRNPGNGNDQDANNLRLDISYLVQYQKVDVSSQDGIGNTALHYACWMNWGSSVINYLLDLGADPYTPNRFGWTALHLASKYCSCRINENVETLLARGGGDLVRCASRGGMTALHWAAQRYDLIDKTWNLEPHAVRALLKAGADPLGVDARGRTPIDIAGPDSLWLFQAAYTLFDGIDTITLSMDSNTITAASPLPRAAASQSALRLTLTSDDDYQRMYGYEPDSHSESEPEPEPHLRSRLEPDSDSGSDPDSDRERAVFFSAPNSRRSTRDFDFDSPRHRLP